MYVQGWHQTLGTSAVSHENHGSQKPQCMYVHPTAVAELATSPYVRLRRTMRCSVLYIYLLVSRRAYRPNPGLGIFSGEFLNTPNNTALLLCPACLHPQNKVGASMPSSLPWIKGVPGARSGGLPLLSSYSWSRWSSARRAETSLPWTCVSMIELFAACGFVPS